MKKMSFVVAASFSLLSFNAFAGGNCLYGHDKNLAEIVVEDAVIAENVNKVDPTLLALLKKQQADKSPLKPVVTFN